mgnify:CR=1 FL=1
MEQKSYMLSVIFMLYIIRQGTTGDRWQVTGELICSLIFCWYCCLEAYVWKIYVEMYCVAINIAIHRLSHHLRAQFCSHDRKRKMATSRSKCQLGRHRLAPPPRQSPRPGSVGHCHHSAVATTSQLCSPPVDSDSGLNCWQWVINDSDQQHSSCLLQFALLYR